MLKAPGGIVSGFEVAIQVFDGRIVLRIIGVQKSSQTQTFSNKASFLCPQGCVLLKNAPEVFIWDQGSSMRHSIYHIKSVLGYSGPEWLWIFKAPQLTIFDKNLQSKAFIEGFQDRSTGTKAYIHSYKYLLDARSHKNWI